MRMRTSERSRRVWAHRAVAGCALAVVAAACSVTQQVKPKDAATCPFLGNNVCAMLTPGGKGEAGMRYINSNAHWSQYNKIIIDPVTFWAGDTTKVSAADQQALANYLYQALQNQVGKKFQIVDQPGPGVMRLQVALIDAETATPVLRSVSMAIPQARVLATLKYIATGTYSFVGGAEAEARVIDAVSGRLLAAVDDRRVGGGSIQTAAQWQWGDAENVADHWAEQTANRLYAFTSGTATPQ